MLEKGDLVIVTEEDRDTFLIGQIVKFIMSDYTPAYPYLIEFREEKYWVRDVIKVTPLVKALL